MAPRGAVDGILGRHVIGWVHDPEDAARRIELEVELDGLTVGQGVADLERGDLLAAGVGDGCHGFRIELPGDLQPGSQHVLAVRVADDGVVLPFANDFTVELELGSSAPAVLVRPAPRRPDRNRGPALEPSRSVAERGPVLLGTDGWLFELDDRPELEVVLGVRAPPPGSIETAASRLVEISRSLREIGIRYLVALVPDKATLYSDRLPVELRPSQGARPAQRLGALLRDENDVELLDLLAPLRDARRYGELVAPTGTTLSWRGGFFAYRAVAKDLAKRFPTLEPRPVTELRLGVEVPLEEGLAARERVVLVGERAERLPAIGGEEVEAELATDRLRALYAPMGRDLEERLRPGSSLLECDQADVVGTALIVHQRGGRRVAALLAEHFSRTIVSPGDQLPLRALEAERPIVAVQLLDERGLFARRR